MAILLQRAKTAFNQIMHSLRWKFEYLRERLEVFWGIYRVDTEHVYSAEENDLIERSAEILLQFFPEPPGAALLQEDVESRCEVLEDLAHRLTQVYGMEDVEFIITDEPELFPPDGSCVFGRTQMEQCIVYINANMLQLENEAVLNHLVNTVIHELRHVMQSEIMTLVNTRGVPYRRRAAWRYTTENYVSGEYDMEAYAKQSIEFDARNFANRVWQGAYRQNNSLGGN